MPKGLHDKYRVERTDGKPIEWCFVLELTDWHARRALETYARSCVKNNPLLAREILLKLNSFRRSLPKKRSGDDDIE